MDGFINPDDFQALLVSKAKELHISLDDGAQANPVPRGAASVRHGIGAGTPSGGARARKDGNMKAEVIDDNDLDMYLLRRKFCRAEKVAEWEQATALPVKELSSRFYGHGDKEDTLFMSAVAALSGSGNNAGEILDRLENNIRWKKRYLLLPAYAALDQHGSGRQVARMEWLAGHNITGDTECRFGWKLAEIMSRTMDLVSETRNQIDSCRVTRQDALADIASR